MNLVKLQDTKLMHKNLFHSYTLTMKDQKEKLKEQFHLSLQQNNEISRNKPTLWGKRPILRKQEDTDERTASKHVYYLGWHRSPAQVGYMRQVLGPGALGRPRGIGWRGRWERGSGWGIHVTPRLIHVNVWQKPLQYCQVISLQLIKINGKKKENKKHAPNYAEREEWNQQN